MEEKIVLDKESFKALAADTRVKILKMLYSRRHMQSEIAASMNLAVPSVKEHLDALVKAGLVERIDDGHKWKYYSLTQKGKAVLDPEQKRIWIVLSVFALSVAGGLTAWGRILLNRFYNPAAPEMAALKTTADAAGTEMMLYSAETTAQAAPTLTLGMIVYGVWLLLLLGMLAYSYIQRRRYLGADLNNSKAINK